MCVYAQIEVMHQESRGSVCQEAEGAENPEQQTWSEHTHTMSLVSLSLICITVSHLCVCGCVWVCLCGCGCVGLFYSALFFSKEETNFKEVTSVYVPVCVSLSISLSFYPSLSQYFCLSVSLYIVT